MLFHLPMCRRLGCVRLRSTVRQWLLRMGGATWAPGNQRGSSDRALFRYAGPRRTVEDCRVHREWPGRWEDVNCYKDFVLVLGWASDRGRTGGHGFQSALSPRQRTHGAFRRDRGDMAHAATVPPGVAVSNETAVRTVPTR